MSPARKPYAQSFETLNLVKQTDLSDEKLFYKDKEGNIFPYLKTDICSKINVFKPYTFFPIFQELDIPFLEREWLRRIEYSIEIGASEEKLASATFGRYLAWCKLKDIKGNTFKDSNKFFSDWYDYQNFHYIYDPPHWRISYENENLITKEERDKISNYFNKQEGRPCPISNQVVICGYVTTDEDKWNNFVKENMKDIIRRRKDSFVLKDKEVWHRIPLSFSVRGYRYYKIKVDKNINRKFLEQIILPCCNNYCCDFEWI
jgi:hypothetical protein